MRAVDLLPRLAQLRTYCVVGENAVTEMARAHESTRKVGRGVKLFECLADFLTDDTLRVIRPTFALTIEEAQNYDERIAFRIYAESEHLEKFRDSVRKLRDGLYPAAADIVRAQKIAAVKSLRELGQILDMPELKEKWRRIPPDKFEEFLDRETGSDLGARFVASHLFAHFGGRNTRDQLLRVATGLLANARYRVARTLARSDIYVNWRRANNDSLPDDTADDFYHVVNASYCNVFVTADEDLSKHARRIFRDDVRVLYFEDSNPDLVDWLELEIAKCAVGAPAR